MRGAGPWRTGLGDRSRLDEIWRSTLDESTRPASPDRAAARGHRCSRALARLLGATPSLTVPWLVAVTAVSGSALAIAWNTDPGTPVPVPGLCSVPAAGSGSAGGRCGRSVWPGWRSRPRSGGGFSVPRFPFAPDPDGCGGDRIDGLALVMALLLPDAGLMAAAWILPALALAATTLAMSTFVSPLTAAAGSVLSGLPGVGAMELGPNTLIEFGWTGQFVFAACSCAAVVVLAARRDTFEVSAMIRTFPRVVARTVRLIPWWHLGLGLAGAFALAASRRRTCIPRTIACSGSGWWPWRLRRRLRSCSTIRRSACSTASRCLCRCSASPASFVMPAVAAGWWVLIVWMESGLATAAEDAAATVPRMALSLEMVALLGVVWAVATLLLRTGREAGGIVAATSLLTVVVGCSWLPERWSLFPSPAPRPGQERHRRDGRAWVDAHRRWAALAALAWVGV